MGLVVVVVVLLFVAFQIVGGNGATLKIEDIDLQSVKLGDEFSMRFVLENPAIWDGKVQWRLDDSPKGAKLDRRKGRITWTPSESGQFDFRVVVRSVDDDQIEDSARFIVKVVQPRSKPSGDDRPRPSPGGRVRIIPIDDVKVRQGEEVGFYVRLSRDVGDADVRYRLGQLAPEGASIDHKTGAFYWKLSHDQQPGDVEIEVRVSVVGRRGWREREQFKVTVLKAIGQPVVEEITDKSVSPGDEIRFQIVASDPNEPPRELKYELDFPPDGAAIDEETGEFTWTPGEDTAGRSIRVAVRVTQSDSPMRSTVRTFQVHVKGDAPDPSPGPDSPIPEVDGVRKLSGHSDFVVWVAMNRRASVVASAAADGTIRIWTIKSGEALQKLEPKTARRVIHDF